MLDFAPETANAQLWSRDEATHRSREHAVGAGSSEDNVELSEVLQGLRGDELSQPDLTDLYEEPVWQRVGIIDLFGLDVVAVIFIGYTPPYPGRFGTELVYCQRAIGSLQTNMRR